MAADKLTVAVTGASGFIGSALVTALGRDARFAARACYRQLPADLPRFASAFEIGDMPGARWRSAFTGADAVVHAAARAHVLDETAADAASLYRRINVDGAIEAMRAAGEAGVKRFVFLSSIKVNGESTPLDRAFTAADEPRPEDPYGFSKLEAEVVLRELAAVAGVTLTIARLPLVYGPGAKGNLARLLRLVWRGIPLPLADIRNARSMIGVDNAVSAIVASLLHGDAAGTFTLADGEDTSTPQFIRSLAAGLGKPARLFGMPEGLLRVAATLVGRRAEVQRLCGSLRVDASAFREHFAWSPPVSVEAGFAGMAAAFAAERRG